MTVKYIEGVKNLTKIMSRECNVCVSMICLPKREARGDSILLIRSRVSERERK
jgi:hypothetical protein